MIAAGDVAPDFTAPTQGGAPLTLSSLRGSPVVLFFFPKANSMGCTIETRAFADRFERFRTAGWNVVGVSVDSVADQATFSTRCHAEFPLVADSDKTIARAYGVLGLFGFARRVTFLIGADGRVEEIITTFSPGAHVERALGRIAGPPRTEPSSAPVPAPGQARP